MIHSRRNCFVTIPLQILGFRSMMLLLRQNSIAYHCRNINLSIVVRLAGVSTFGVLLYVLLGFQIKLHAFQNIKYVLRMSTKYFKALKRQNAHF